MSPQPNHDCTSAAGPVERYRASASICLKTLVEEAACMAFACKKVDFTTNIPDDACGVAVDFIGARRIIAGLMETASIGLGENNCIELEACRLVIDSETMPRLALPDGAYVKITLRTTQGEIQPLPPTWENQDGIMGLSCNAGPDGEIIFYLLADLNAAAEQTEQPVRPRILVMDDEETVCEIASQMLEYLGYQVDVAPDGDQAAFMYQEARDQNRPFDAVILDLSVPDGAGAAETVKRLEAIDPNVKAFISSGYSNDPAMCQFQEHGFSGAIKKPFHLKSLSGLLDSIIGSKKTDISV